MSRFDLSNPLVAGAASLAAALVCMNMTWLVTTMFGLMSGFVGRADIYYLWAAEALLWLALAPVLCARLMRDARGRTGSHA